MALQMRCRACGHTEEGLGEYPFIFQFAASAVTYAIGCAALVGRFQAWAFAIAAGPALAILYGMATAPLWLTRRQFREKKCSACGDCQWSKPYSTGFGL